MASAVQWNASSSCSSIQKIPNCRLQPALVSFWAGKGWGSGKRKGPNTCLILNDLRKLIVCARTHTHNDLFRHTHLEVHVLQVLENKTKYIIPSDNDFFSGGGVRFILPLSKLVCAFVCCFLLLLFFDGAVRRSKNFNLCIAQSHVSVNVSHIVIFL